MATLCSRSSLRAAAATLGDAAVARSDLQFSASSLVYKEAVRYQLFRAFWDRIHRIEAAESAKEIIRKIIR